MAKTMLAISILAGACTSAPPKLSNPVVVPTSTGSEPSTVEPPTTTTTEAPDTTTTTEPPAEPVPVTTIYVAPRRTTTTTVYEPPAPQGRTTRSDVWAALADCESGGANVDTGNGYSGFFQFLDSTWRSVGYSGRAVEHSYGTQVAAAQTLQARSGWGQWPACASQLGLL